MKLNSKSILTAIVILIMIVSLFLVLMLTEKLLSIWHYLQEAPLWVSLLYATVIFAVAAFGVYLYFVLIRPKPIKKKLQPIDESSLRDSLQQQAVRGVDTTEAQAELVELDKRRGHGKFYIALYGTVSSGKSSFIQALLPQTEVETNVLSGTTKTIGQYSYKNLSIIDLPGLDDFDEELEKLAIDETLRAHVVVFLTDSDLTQTEMRVISKLRKTKKPMVIALNKSDRYQDDEQKLIVEALKNKTEKHYPVALISTGGKETIIYQDAKGNRQKKVKNRPANIKPLIKAIEKVVANNPEILNR
ncbi:MAG TPA: hypothetical protein ENJ44_03825, partial [Oceanospirillales bacterium]|nr:hypothetical protein [Oceanospirillales bacterium]